MEFFSFILNRNDAEQILYMLSAIKANFLKITKFSDGMVQYENTDMFHIGYGQIYIQEFEGRISDFNEEEKKKIAILGTGNVFLEIDYNNIEYAKFIIYNIIKYASEKKITNILVQDSLSGKLLTIEEYSNGG